MAPNVIRGKSSAGVVDRHYELNVCALASATYPRGTATSALRQPLIAGRAGGTCTALVAVTRARARVTASSLLPGTWYIAGTR